MPCSVARFTFTAVLLVTVAACTQTPAQIELRGHNVYGPGSANGYASVNPQTSFGRSTGYQPAPVYANTTVAAAPANAIGVSDLAPPSRSGWSSAGNERRIEEKKLVAPVSAKEPKNVNPWTGKARPVELSGAGGESFRLHPQGQRDHAREPMVSEVKQHNKPVAELDTIIGNDAATARSKGASSPSSGFMWPVASKKVISGFGPKGRGKVNDGINIASAEREPVWAAADGEVVYAGNELKGYGNMALIKHAGGKSTTYAHMSRIVVDKYERVKQGDIIGYVGSTGNIKAPQLHFAIRDGRDPVDPIRLLNRKVASLR